MANSTVFNPFTKRLDYTGSGSATTSLPTADQVYAFFVYRTTNWTPAFNTDIAFNAAKYNYGGKFDTTTNHVYTAPVAGIYTFKYSLQFNSKVVAGFTVQLDINSFTQYITHEWATASETDMMWGTFEVALAANDTVGLALNENTNNLLGGDPLTANVGTWFTGRLVALVPAAGFVGANAALTLLGP